jgi:hypothetical protein
MDELVGADGTVEDPGSCVEVDVSRPGAEANPIEDASAGAVLADRGTAGTNPGDDAGLTASRLGTGAEGGVATLRGLESWSAEAATEGAGAPGIGSGAKGGAATSRRLETWSADATTEESGVPDVTHVPADVGRAWGRMSVPCNAHESG